MSLMPSADAVTCEPREHGLVVFFVYAFSFVTLRTAQLNGRRYRAPPPRARRTAAAQPTPKIRSQLIPEQIEDAEQDCPYVSVHRQLFQARSQTLDFIASGAPLLFLCKTPRFDRLRYKITVAIRFAKRCHRANWVKTISGILNSTPVAPHAISSHLPNHDSTPA